VSCLAFSPDGRTLAAGGDRGIRRWDLTTGREMPSWRGITNTVLSLAFSPDGKRLASADAGADLRLWDPAENRVLRRLPGGTACAFSPDGKVLAFNGGCSVIRFWDLAADREASPAGGHQGEVTAVAFRPGREGLVSAGTDHTIRFWELAGGKEVRRLNPGGVHSLSLAPDGQLLAWAGQDGEVCLAEAATGKVLHRWPWAPPGVRSVVFSPDGKLLAAAERGANGGLRRWEVATGKELPRIEAYGPLAFSPDGRTLAGLKRCLVHGPPRGFDRGPWPGLAIALWEAAAGTELRQFEGRPWPVVSLAFSPDGRMLAAAGGEHSAAILWEVASGKPRGQVAGPGEGGLYVVAFSPGGQLLACGGGIRYGSGQVKVALRLWDVVGDGPPRDLAGHRGLVKALAFSADGRRLASGSEDTTVLVWDTTRLAPALPAHAAPLSPEEARALWRELASEDATAAYRAVRALAAAPGPAVPLLQARLRSPSPAEVQRAERLIADLGSDVFSVRDRATRELERLGDAAGAALHRALERDPALEVRRRLERLLAGIEAARLRSTRAVEALEHIGTPEARQLLEVLARGAAEVPLTREARAVLRRLGERQAGRP
jgi:WD40 repeat protein